jgi:hypothetical protein
MIVLIAAAMPVRISDAFPVVRSVSVLDVLLVVLALTLCLDLASHPLDTGYENLFLLLVIPLSVTTASVVWSQDRPATVRAVLIYTEGIIAYLFVIRELDGLSPERVITYIARYAYLVIIPGVLLLLHVPGFAPEQAGLSHSSGDYLSYYTRLSHPVLGRSNNLATVLAFFAPILLYWGHTRGNRRITLAGSVTLLAICLTLSRGVLLSFAVAGLVYAVLVFDRRRFAGSRFGGKLVGIVAAGVLAIGALYLVNPATHEFFAGRLSLANVHGRIALITTSFGEVARRPVLGFGGGVDPMFEATHNTYVQQAVYFGLPLAIVVSIALWGTVSVFLARRRWSGVAGVIAYTLLVQLISFLFEASFEGTVLRVLFYLSVGLAVGLLRSVEAERADPISP